MFEPLGESENEKSATSRSGMRAIWIVVIVAMLVLVAFAFV